MGIFRSRSTDVKRKKEKKKRERAQRLADQADNSNVTFYLRNLELMRASMRAQSKGLIDPQLSAVIASALRDNGLSTTALGEAFATGAYTIPTIEASGLAEGAAKDLHELQGAITQLRRGVLNPELRGENVRTAAVTGAVQGFVVGGPVGAVAGLVGGGIAGRSRNKAKAKSRKKIRDAANEAAYRASPAHFMTNFAPLLAKAREETVLAGQQAQLAAESDIERRGLRGTGTGAERSISAGVLPEIAALRKATGGATTISRQETATRLGSTIYPPRINTNLEKILEAGATIYASFNTPEAVARRQERKRLEEEESAIQQSVYDEGAEVP